MFTRTKFVIYLILSLLLTIPLVAVFYLAEQGVGTPLPAFDLMDFLIRNLPGGVVTFGIDTMTDFLINTGLASGDNLDNTAKTAEQIMAILQFIGIGTLIGFLYGFIVHWMHQTGKFLTTDYASGLILGLAVGIPLALISIEYNVSATTGTGVTAVWILAAMLGWGLLHNWAHRILARQEEPAAVVASETEAAAPAPVAASVNIIDRRQFLIRIGSASAAITVVGAGLGALLHDEQTVVGGDIDIAELGEGLEPASGTRPEYTPLENHYRIDINSGRTPAVDGAEWRLVVTGMVAQELEYTLDDLRNNYESVDRFITLSCISNRIGGGLISTTRWTGVPFHQIISEWDLDEGASWLRISSVDGFYEFVSIEEIMNDERIMLTYEWDGVPLPEKHGFPLRIYLPNRYGMKQPKWITSIEVVAEWDEGYWVERSWDKDAFVRATSVIDTVAVDSLVTDGERTLVPIGGIAYSGERGISKVEVQVDNGEWVEARLREPLSDTTWVIWRLDWEFQPGEHTFTVRCQEGDGTPQIEEVMPNRPSGATGLHSKEATLETI